MNKIPILKLAVSFDVGLLQRDLKFCLKESWSAHYNQQSYSGDWSIISLRSADGNPQNVNAISFNSEFQDTSLLYRCPYFKMVLDSFLCDKSSVRLMNLAAGASIKEHADLDLSFQSGILRLHIPIQTNEAVEFYVDNQRVVMNEGECWYGNFELPHKVFNKSEEDRIHLVIDCLRNDWLDQLFVNSGFDLANEIQKEEQVYSQEQITQMIAEFERMNTETSLKLAKELKTKLL